MKLAVSNSLQSAPRAWHSYISAEFLFLAALACSTTLVALHFLVIAKGWTNLERFLSLDYETGLGTWFSSMQLALIGLVALTIVVPTKGIPQALRWQLPLMAFVFLFLSADEATGIHEHITRLSHNRPWIPDFDGHHAWVLPYLTIAAVIGLVVYQSAVWLFTSFPKIFWITCAGLVTYFVGVIAFDQISVFLLPSGTSGVIVIAAEEWLEMFGVSILLYAMLRLKQSIEAAD